MSGPSYLNSVNLKQDSDFPYLVLEVINDESYPRNPGFQVMHWHEDLQFIYVLEGEIEVVTLSEGVRLRRGDGVFLNRNVVHLVRKVTACHYKSFLFPERFLKFYPGSPAERMVEQIVGRPELPIRAIREEEGAVTRLLQKLSRMEEGKTTWYPYEVLTTLCQLWLAFSQTVSIPERPPRGSAAEERVEVFLRYIAQHYSSEVTLDALAASASVSKSECLRCFKTVLRSTPYRYLTEYRLAKAAERLRQTDEPISVIAAEVGFDHLSHFGKRFREKTGMSPREYRKRQTEGAEKARKVAEI